MRRLLLLALPLAFVSLSFGCSSFLGDGGDEGAEGDESPGEGGTGDDGGEAGDAGGEGGSFNDYCESQVDWDADWVAFENEVLEIVNANRAAGATCGGESFGSTGPMVAEAQLRCAARVHSEDMAVRGFFAHDNPDGESPWDRVAKTDYTGNPTGENIAQGYPDPEAVMEGWMNSPGHCSNIMNPNSTEIGIGLYGDGNYWTQVMGTR